MSTPTTHIVAIHRTTNIEYRFTPSEWYTIDNKNYFFIKLNCYTK